MSEEDAVNKSYKRLLLCIADEFFSPIEEGLFCIHPYSDLSVNHTYSCGTSACHEVL